MHLLKKDNAEKKSSSRTSRRLDKVLPYALSTPAMFFIVFFLLVPLAYCLYCSFWRCDYMNFTKFVGFKNYIDIFKKPDTIKSIGLSFYISFVSLAIALVSGTLLALWINASSGRFAYVLELIILVPWVTSQVVCAMLWKWLLKDDTGLMNYVLNQLGIDSIPFLSSRTIVVYSLIGVMTWRVIGYVMVQLVAGLKGIPKEFEEAAMIDGANKWQLFWRVRLPQLKTPVACSRLFRLLPRLSGRGSFSA